MTTVTSLTADRMLAIEAASVVDGDVDVNGNLILTKHDGSKINAGSVMGPQGPQGPVGSMLSVLSARTIQDVGLSNQIRAGRQLSPADFGNIGLSAPAGLWNLSDLSDASGNGRNLNNKGAVPFATGINGLANTAAQFVGSTAQALYIPDTGANDPFRIKTGSWGCWFKTAKRGLVQYLMAKVSAAGTNAGASYSLGVTAANTIYGIVCDGTTAATVPGVSDVADDRWHFAVITYDGSSLSMYIDGVLESRISTNIVIQGIAQPLNIGSYGGDAGTSSVSPFYGRIDEAFVTADVLSEDQIRNLYCAKIPHTLGVAPTRVSLNVRRRRRGAALAAADFPIQPLRLHNFSAGSLGDEGSNAVALTNNGAAVPVAGVDGSSGNAFNFNGSQSLSATDAALPAALVARSYGVWFKTAVSTSASDTLLSWGALYTGDVRLRVAAGTLSSNSVADAMSGGFVADGVWHFAVGVEDNGAIDGVKRKLYCDGRLVGISPNLPALILAGANSFRIGAAGAASNGTLPFIGQIDGVFVCDYALTAEQIATLYAKSLLALLPSPKNVGDHIEAMDAASLLATFDTLETNAQVDVGVAA